MKFHAADPFEVRSGSVQTRNFLWKFHRKFHGFVSVEFPREIPRLSLCGTFCRNSTGSSTVLIPRFCLRGNFTILCRASLIVPYRHPCAPMLACQCKYPVDVSRKPCALSRQVSTGAQSLENTLQTQSAVP